VSGKLSFRERFEAQLKQCSTDLEELDKKSKEFEESLKQKFEKHAPEFRSLLQEGQSSLNTIKSMTDDDVERLKGHFEFTAHALKESFNVFKEDFDERLDKKRGKKD